MTVLSFPPHCSHKLQPLDGSDYGPLKKYFNKASGNWLASNPGKKITIYDIPALLETSLPLAATIDNIQSGFIVTGISPLNENIFPDSEFSGSYVTDRPMPSSHNVTYSSTADKGAVAVPSTSSSHDVTYSSTAVEGAVAVPSTSHTRTSDSLSFGDEVPIPNVHTVTETQILASQCPTAIIDQITAALPSRTRSSSTECESPPIIDEISNFLYQEELRENLKTPENLRPPELETLLNLTPSSNLNHPHTKP